MSEIKPGDFNDVIDEEMTVTINTDEGDITCQIITILTVDNKDYIALLPLDKDGNPTEDVWFYGYKEDPNDPNKEPELIYIDDDEELENVFDKYDEYLDDLEFDES